MKGISNGLFVVLCVIISGCQLPSGQLFSGGSIDDGNFNGVWNVTSATNQNGLEICDNFSFEIIQTEDRLSIGKRRTRCGANTSAFQTAEILVEVWGANLKVGDDVVGLITDDSILIRQVYGTREMVFELTPNGLDYNYIDSFENVWNLRGGILQSDLP